MLFTAPVGIDLDSVPPNVTGQSTNTSLDLVSSLYQDNGGIVSWTGNGHGTLTPAACANLISTQGTTSVKPAVNSIFCAKTAQGNIALIRVQRISVDTSDSMTATLVRATVWSNGPPSSPSPVTWSRHWGPGTLLFTAPVGIDLDSIPPNVTGQSTNTSLDLVSNQYQDSNGVVSWTGNGTGTPTAAACANLISTEGVSGIKPVVNKTFCARTAQGNIAIITVQHISVDTSNSMTSTLVRASIWSHS